MKIPILFLVLVMLSACSSYGYRFDSIKLALVAKSKHPISCISIESKKGSALFDAIKGTRSFEFSLKTFSPDYFKCWGCDFRFDTGIVYTVHPLPKGDVAGFYINVVLLPDGRVIQVPFESSALPNPNSKDSSTRIQIKN